MKANLRIGVISLAVLFVGGGLGACTTQAAGGTGGSGATGATTGTGGTGVGGGSAGGATGNGIVCNPSNNTTNLAPSAGIACPPPPSTGLITDFTVAADAGTPDGGATQARFGDDSTLLSGGESTYANSPGTITSDVSAGNWHITANVANYAGFSLYFDDVTVNNMSCNMIDASAYTGISFKIWGSTASQPITMGIGIVDDTPPPSWLSSIGVTPGTTPVPAGSCIPNAGGTQYYHPGCGDPTAPAINIPTGATDATTAQTVSLKWADFVNGTCKPNVIPSQIVSIYWQFAWSGTATPYAVDMHIDDITFTK
jgi:hypothetical protein